MKNLSIEELGSLSIPLPDKLIQERIAKFLSTEIKQIDGIIFDKEQMLALLEEKRKAYISRVVMHGLDSTAPLKSSGHAWLGDIPTHWQLQPIKYLAHVGNGSTPSVDNEDYWTEDGFPWLNSSVVNQAVARIPSRFVTAHALRECHLPVIYPPAVLVGITGQGKTRGMASLLAIKATINQHLAYLKPKDDRLSANYLRAILMHAYEFLRSDSDGAGSTKGAITCEQLANTKIPIPPAKEQEEICSRIEQFAEKSEPLIANVRTSINLLRSRRNALITAAVTGQIPLEEMTP
jgi:type I restriction enzyme S subunit